jgi:hypothetical protein
VSTIDISSEEEESHLTKKEKCISTWKVGRKKIMGRPAYPKEKSEKKSNDRLGRELSPALTMFTFDLPRKDKAPNGDVDQPRQQLQPDQVVVCCCAVS